MAAIAKLKEHPTLKTGGKFQQSSRRTMASWYQATAHLLSLRDSQIWYSTEPL